MSNKTGTREWAEVTKNIQIGCEHGCLYCYARASAVRFKKLPSALLETPLAKFVPSARLYSGRIMFPSAHDITPANVERCEEFLKQLLEIGNEVVIVTKPTLSCVNRLLNSLVEWKRQVLWRMTIGSSCTDALLMWEPNAPAFTERLAALRLAHDLGWATSVSMEPMLDTTPWRVIDLVRPYVTESIWLGLMRHHRQRLALNVPHNVAARIAGDDLADAWSDEVVILIYRMYQNDPLIRWKDSIRKVVGI